jgi:pSer/pThr/pTyr-binding forkhead associated (FHA) protein
LVNGPEIIVRERGSKNGTFVNGQRVLSQVQVKHGQVINFARVLARLDLELPGAQHTQYSATAEYREFAANQEERCGQPGWPKIIRPSERLQS